MKKWLIVLVLGLFFLCGCEGEVVNNLGEQKEVIKENLAVEEEQYLLKRIEDLKYLDFYGKSSKTSKLANQEVLQILNDMIGGLDKISFSDLESKALLYLDYYLNPEDLLCDTHFNILGVSSYIYYYDSVNKVYKLNTDHIKHNEIGVRVNVFNNLKESYKVGDTYTVVVYKIFSELLNSDNTNINNYYPTYNEALAREGMIFSETSNVKNKMMEDVSKLREYTYTFVKKDNEYTLKEYNIG